MIGDSGNQSPLTHTHTHKKILHVEVKIVNIFKKFNYIKILYVIFLNFNILNLNKKKKINLGSELHAHLFKNLALPFCWRLCFLFITHIRLLLIRIMGLIEHNLFSVPLKWNRIRNSINNRDGNSKIKGERKIKQEAEFWGREPVFSVFVKDLSPH